MTLLRRAVDVAPDEVNATLMSFVFFFFVLSGYFVLRPIRDAVAAASGVQELPWLFAGTLTATLLFNPLFWALVVRYPARKFVPISFQFFIANLLVFYVLMRRVAGNKPLKLHGAVPDAVEAPIVPVHAPHGGASARPVLAAPVQPLD